ncbi:MAG: type III-A CRISPR-associated RAMP protein Csm5 [Desulfoplanes sp.]
MNNEVQTWKLTTLTPLHIGDGNELQYNLDYTKGRNEIEVLDVDSILEELGSIPGAINEMGKENFDLLRFMRDFHITKQYLYTMPYRGDRAPRSIRSFIKDACGRIYIPGSSLKGALRTALWVTALDRKDLPRAQGAINDYKKSVHNIMSPSPHTDFLRSFQVSDSIGQTPQNYLAATEIKFFNLLNGNRAGWIDFGQRRQNKTSFQEAQGIVVETVQPGHDFVLKFRAKDFLQTPVIQQLAHIPNCPSIHDRKSICEAVNRHSLDIIFKEKDFFSQFGTETAGVTSYYNALKTILLEESSEQNTIITRMSWGSGWKGMTGDWMDENQLRYVREKAHLGKQGVPVFPKSRRLAMQDGVPSLPLGWVKLTLCADDSSFIQSGRALGILSSAEVPQIHKEKTTPIQQPLQPVKSLEEIRKEAQESFDAYLSKVANIAGEIAGIEAKITLQKDTEAQKYMVEKLVSKAKNVPNFKKAKKNNKQWVLKIAALATEHKIPF